MTDYPLVSIIIPCYNYGQFIEETIKSASEQTYENIEIIVVNDASTDPLTIRVLEKLEQNNNIVVIHHEKNKGLPAARNTAIKAASGKFILPLDADDTIEPTIVEKTAKVLIEKPNVGFVSVGMRCFGDTNSTYLPPKYNFHTLLHQNIVTVTSLFRKKAWSQVGGYNEELIYGYEDWEFWINLAKHGWQGSCVEELLFNYRKHGKSMIDDAVKKHSFIINQIIEIHKDLYTSKLVNNKKTKQKITKSYSFRNNDIS
jgi:glycosyltransferase involved in cell wall biosynthesis